MKRLKESERVLTKTVKFNLSIPWMTKTFNFQIPPVILLRHPISVVISQERNFNQNFLKDFVLSESVNNERLVENREYIFSLKSKLEQRIAIWCINNVPTLKDEKCNEQWKVIFYEIPGI